ncbi:26S proteasome regulatory subunit N8 [Pancytospora philotis]|nr:26S proteasome regulatory subunit N8 [Pancytospora philotis]
MASRTVTIAPLVLLSVVDHYKRLSTPRVMGILLGTVAEGTVDVTNSFAVPFEDLENDFLLDTSYLQHMFELYHKVNSKESIVGWYHSGPKLHGSDIHISKALVRYCPAPILAVVNVHGEHKDIPVQVFGLSRDGVFNHMNLKIGAEETEEVGVEHLLRDIKDGTGCSIKDKIGEICDSLRTYEECLGTIVDYISAVQKGKPRNRQILELFQEILNSVPCYSSSASLDQLYIAELASTLVAMQDYENSKVGQ